MTDRHDYPTHRLAATLLDIVDVVDQACDRITHAGIDNNESRRDARIAVLGEAVAEWQVETRGQTLTPEYVTDVLDDLRRHAAEAAPAVAAQTGGVR